MTKKPNILIIGDIPGWAFHNIITFVRTKVNGYNFYYDYTIYNPIENSKVTSDFEAKSHHIAPRTLKKTIPFQQTFLLKGLVYRVINCLNQLGLLSYNGDGQFRRIRKDNTYDMVLFLDYYMDKDADFGHTDAGLVSELAHRVQDPGFVCIGRLGDDLDTGCPLGHGLADEQRNESTSKAHHHGKAQQCAEIESVGGQELVDTQQAGHNTQDQHDGQVGDDEKNDAFHEVL